MVKKNLEVIGKWAFIVGLALAIIAGLIAGIYTIPALALILVILGLIVGFLNIADKDVTKLLVAIIALMAVGAITLAEIPIIDTYLGSMLANILVFAGGVGLVVAVKAIYEIGKK